MNLSAWRGSWRADLPANARVLEIAPGPGYLSVALAKLGPFKITGLDISQSFVKMASQYAKREGVTARFIHGSASDIPLEDGLFDLIVCRAAFKNFSEPLKALNEMHRVLKPGGRAIIIDLRKDASWDEIVAYVDGLHISRTNTWMTKFTFKHMLLKRAYTEGQMIVARGRIGFQILRNHQNRASAWKSGSSAGSLSRSRWPELRTVGPDFEAGVPRPCRFTRAGLLRLLSDLASAQGSMRFKPGSFFE